MGLQSVWSLRFFLPNSQRNSDRDDSAYYAIATEVAITFEAPALINAVAHELMVAPVVTTGSQ